MNMARISRIVLSLSLLIFLAMSNASAQNAEKGTHVVQQGETLYRISKMYGVTVEKLYQLNPEAREGINPGQVLQLPSFKDDKEATYHMIQGGQTLYSIAKEYGVTVEEILKANSQIKSEKEIAAGMIIKIPPRSSITIPEKPTVAIESPKNGMTGLKLITVPQGATVYSILRQTGWSEAQLLHYNPQLKDGLKAGMSILIPDTTVENNLAAGSTTNEGLLPMGGVPTIVLALPFAKDSNQRFKHYYEGFLMALLELKQSGANFAIHVLDCGDDHLTSTIQEISALPRVDMILGGVSESSVSQLADLARQKSATYVIPFTSRNYSNAESSGMEVFQVNTPHTSLYLAAARKFVEEYRDYHVHILNFSSENNSKDSFIDILRQELNRNGINYTEAPQSTFSTPDAVKLLSQSHGKVVVVPTSGSVAAANKTLQPISEAIETLGVINVTAFGYPEWQTYVQGIGKLLKSTEASFFTTFHADSESTDYKSFERDFRKWYGHGLGSTFPRYGILGYDTGRFFLTHLYRNGATYSVSRGIQSEFKFENNKQNPNIHSNLGVFFVKYNSLGSSIRY